MKRLRLLFTRPFPHAIESLPGGSYLIGAFYALMGLFLNGSWVYSLVSGKILHRWHFEWLEARESSPGLYWSYIAGFGVVVLFIDGFLAYGVWKNSYNEPKA